MSNSSAPGAAAGYLYQFERALLRLAECKAGDRVGIETLDDVVVQSRGATSILEQDKHSISAAGHPLTDRSRQLWRTLEIWIGYLVDAGDADSSTEFHLVTNRAVPDCLARRIATATAPEHVTAVLELMRTEAVRPDDASSETIRRVLGSPERFLRRLIQNVRLTDGVNQPATEIRSQITATLPFPRGIESSSVVDELFGWVQGVVMESWRTGTPAWVSRDAFATQFHAILDRRKRERFLERSTRLLPEPEPSEVGRHQSRIFVRQVQLVSSDDDDVNDAIRAYIQARDEKLRLSQDGDITRDDWLDFDQRLCDRWRRISRRVLATNSNSSDEGRGRQVFEETLEHKEHLAGQPTNEQYLTAGSYHGLADEPQLGWHPKWKEHFPKK